jgi:hypothetical protein
LEKGRLCFFESLAHHVGLVYNELALARFGR